LLDAGQGELAARNRNPGQSELLAGKLEAAILEFNRIDADHRPVRLLERYAQPGQLGLDLFDHGIEFLSAIAGPIAGRQAQHPFGWHGQRVLEVGRELVEPKVSEAECSREHDRVQVDLTGQFDLSAERGTCGNLVLALIVWQRGQVVQFQIERLDGRGETFRGTPAIGVVDLATGKDEATDVETWQPLLFLGLFLLAFQSVEEGCPVQFAFRQLHYRRLRAVQTDCVEHQRALRDARTRDIDEQAVKAEQRLAIRVAQLQLAEAQRELEGIELRSIHDQLVAGLFGNELLGLRLEDARQRLPE